MPLPLPVEFNEDWYPHYSSMHSDIVSLQSVPPGETLGTGTIQLDSYSGTDTSRYNQAVVDAQARTHIPWIMFPARQVNLTGPFNFFNGMKLCGPSGANTGPKNLEIDAAGHLVSHRIVVQASGGAVFRATGTINDVVWDGLAFEAGTTNTQLASSTGGNGIYPAEFRAITAYGFNGVWGSGTQKFLCTQTRFTGHHTYLAHRGQQWQFGGSDNDFWLEGYLNMNSPASIAGGGAYQGRFDSCQKSRVGFIYGTTEGTWAGVRVTGSGDLIFFHGVYEGRAADNLSQYPLMSFEGGKNVMYGTHFGYAGDTVNTDGAVHLSGANTYLKLVDCSYLRGTATAATFPLVYSTAGVLRYEDLICMTGSEQIRLRFATAGSGGNLFTVPALVDSTH